MQPTASGLLSVQDELQQRKKRRAAGTDDAKPADRSAAAGSQSEYEPKRFKGKKLSTDFHMPKEGINFHNDAGPASSPRSAKKHLLDIDKYKVRGRGPNVSLLSESAKTPSAKLEAERLRVLKAKARAYEALTNSARTGEYTQDADDDNALIDFRRKAAEEDEHDNQPGPSRPSRDRCNDDADEDEDEGEEQITYTDDLGRTRTAPRSQVPPEFLPENNQYSQSVNVEYGRQTAFPVYRPPSPKLRVARAVRKQIESGAPPLQHFDARAENRNRGAGLFHFSKNEEERVRQMDALQRERERTERERRSRIGELERLPRAQVEGFAPADDRPWGAEGNDYEEGTLDHAPQQQRVPKEEEPADPFAAVEREAKRARTGSAEQEPGGQPSPAEEFDPFAAVELAERGHAVAGRSKSKKGSAKR